MCRTCAYISRSVSGVVHYQRYRPGGEYRYLLDTNIVIVFQKARQLDALIAAAARIALAVVDDVRDELTLPKPTKPVTAEMREAARALGGSAITIEEIALGSPEDELRMALRERGSSGRGEAASVAFAITREDHIVVTTDRAAVAGAAKLYNELPGEVGRILGLHAFSWTLAAHEALAMTTAKSVAEAAKAESKLVPPLWWASWLEQSCPPSSGSAEGTSGGQAP